MRRGASFNLGQWVGPVLFGLAWVGACGPSRAAGAEEAERADLAREALRCEQALLAADVPDLPAGAVSLRVKRLTRSRSSEDAVADPAPVADRSGENRGEK